jgi:hypothetical protein
MTFNERLHPRDPANGEFVDTPGVKGLEHVAEALARTPQARAAAKKAATPKRRKLTPDEQDLADELEANGAKINPDATVTVYHFTTKEDADRIRRTGRMTAAEDGLFFTTKDDGGQGGAGRGGVKVTFRVPLAAAELDDAFGDEAHIRVPLSRAGAVKDVSGWVVR